MWRVLSALCLIAAPVHAEFFPIRDADYERLANLDNSFGSAMRFALAAGAAEDLGVLLEAMEGWTANGDMSGVWACRTIKVGGLTPITAYGDFQCRITQVEPGIWYLEKLTGSQRPPRRHSR